MIIVDLDGTLRDSSCGDHLMPDDPTKARNWLEWQEYVNEHGKLIKQTARLLEIMHINAYVVVVTSSQFGTERWLNINGLAADAIIERERDDDRHGFKFKKSFIDEYANNIDLWIDDDAQVLDYVESLGILTVRIYPERYNRDNILQLG